MSTNRKSSRKRIQALWARIKRSTKRPTTPPSPRPTMFSRLKTRFNRLFKRFDGRLESSSESPSLDDQVGSDFNEVPSEKPKRKTFLDEMYVILQEDANGLNVNCHRRGPTGIFCSFRQKPKRSISSTKDEEVVLDLSYPMNVQLWLNRSCYWDFDTASFDRATGGRCIPTLGMHLFVGYGLINFFKLLPESCLKLFRTIEDCYHASNPYHNSVHAADVTQAVHCFLQEPPLSCNLSPLEVMVVLLAAITHDLDHPGVNHSFLVATNHPLAIMYKDHKLGSRDRSPLPYSERRDRKLRELLLTLRSRNESFSPLASRSLPRNITSFFRKHSREDSFPCESLLEHHHWRVAYSVILESGIFDHMQERLPEIQSMLRSLILATDITRQNEYLTVFKDHLKHHTLDMERPDHRQMVLQMALKTADISNPGRPWSISKKWSHSVCDEFYKQGDKEMELNLKVSKLCDREIDTVPKIQTGFFRYVVTPLFTEWHHYLKSPLSRTMLTNLIHNEAEWAREDRRSSQASKSLTLSDLHKISDADLVENNLDSSTLRSKSTMSFGTDELRAYLIDQRGRRSSHSPMKKSTFAEVMRRYSEPLHSGLRHAPSKVSSMLDLFLRAKQRRLADEADAGPSDELPPPPRKAQQPLNEISTPRRRLLGYVVQLDSDDDDDEGTSSDEKGGVNIASVIIEESSLSSGSAPTGAALSSGSARVGLLSPQSASVSNSEGHLNKIFEDDATRGKSVLRAPGARRGSAPAAGALARLAAELTHQLHHKHSASCHQWVTSEAPEQGARRGSLPAEVMSGISA